MFKKKTAKDIMSHNVFTVYDDMDVNYAEVFAEAQHIRHVPVLNRSEKLIGMLSIRDILEHLTRNDGTRFSKVAELMTQDPLSIAPQTDLKTVAKLMYENKISALPVEENDRVVGIISERDFLPLFM